MSKLTRREALKHLTHASLGVLLYSECISASKETSAYNSHKAAISIREGDFETVISNGKAFIDGKLQEGWHIGILKDGKIKVSQSPLQGKLQIDANNKVISPGFVDILADNASHPQSTYSIFEKYKVTDGLTTVLQMHGGSDNPRQFHEYFDKLPHKVNYGVSVFVMKIRLVYASFAKRYQLAERGLKEGALAMAHSPEYQPDTSYAELKKYAEIAQKYDRPFFLHLRYSSQEKELEGVKEAIRLAKETGAKIHIDHLNSTGGTFNMPQALELIEDANDQGSHVTFCVYPYSFWATYLISERFSTGWQDRYKISYNDLQVVGTGERLTAQTFQMYRNRPGLLVAVPPGTMPFEKTINLALKSKYCMFGSDGGIEKEPRANSHPRGAGFAATAIRHCLTIGMTIEEALERLVTRPVQLIQPAMQGRGALKDGHMADITIFDPATIQGQATVSNPNQFSKGIHYVFVNGKMVVSSGKLLNTVNPGVGIKYT